MIGKDSEEQPVFKVTDKRKFNVDGSVREGVEIKEEKPKEKAQTIEQPQEAQAPENPEPASAKMQEQQTSSEEAFDETEEIPGADEPASFVNFLTTLAAQAAAALGAVPHPATGQRTVDLETGRYWIDVLAMIQEKTKGNLHAQESRLLEGLLSDLRMQFVQISRLAEEKLKEKAAQKFSAQDILGKK